MNDKKILFKNEKIVLIISGISLYILAWIFYYLPHEYTGIGILVHYISLLFMGLGIGDFSKAKKIVIFIVVYLISLFLDYPFYEIRHGLNLGLFYYVTVNMIHIMLFLSTLFFQKNEKTMILSSIVFMDFLTNFYLWMLMSILPLELITLVIFFISLPSLIIFVPCFLKIND
ncbi:MAG: hypothetical protein ACTSVY_14930 [Candidatus Helarchaeota archaeon]